MNTKRSISLLLIWCMVLLPVPAFAEIIYAPSPGYVYSNTPNTTATQSDYLDAGDGAVVTAAEVKYLIQPGDQVRIKWYTETGSVIATDTLAMNGSPETVSPPANAHAAQLILATGSASGGRWAWWRSSTSNTTGNTTIFPDPDTTGGGGGTVDLTPVVNELQTIQGQIATILGKLDTIIANGGGGTGGDIGDVVAAIQSQTSAIGSKFNEVTGQLSGINGKLTTIQDQLDTLDSHVVDVYDYLSIPRTSEPFNVSLPTMTVDPTPPPITEPPQQPYKYNKETPQMPPFTDSPGPLPLAPDPTVMEHDPAAQINPPVEVEQPLAADPVARDNPLPTDPVGMDTPRQPDPVNMQQPASRDPVIKEAPRTLDPVATDPPITRSDPIQASEPLAKDSPYQRATPVEPEPPR